MGPTHKEHLWQGKQYNWLFGTEPEHWGYLNQGTSLLCPCEYASTDCDPQTQSNIQKLETVQWRATRYVKNRPHNTSSVSDMLRTLKWWSLQDRRKDATLYWMYKIDRRLIPIEKDKRLVPLTRKKNTRHSHTRAFLLPSCRTERGRMSFFPRTVSDWNALPPDTIKAESLEAIKARVTH